MTSYVFNMRHGAYAHSRRFDDIDSAEEYARSVWDSLNAAEIRSILDHGVFNITVEYNGTIVWDLVSEYDGVAIGFTIDDRDAIARVVWLTFGRAALEIEHRSEGSTVGFQYVLVDSHEDLYRQIQILKETPQQAFRHEPDIWGCPVFHMYAHECMTAEQIEEVTE